MQTEKKSGEILIAQAPISCASSEPRADARQWRHLGIAIALLVLAFYAPLWRLFRFAAEPSNDLYSYMLLLPFACVYLVWMKKKTLPGESKPMPGLGAIFALAGAGMLAQHWLGRSHQHAAIEDWLAVYMSSFFLFFAGVCCVCLGRKTLAAAAIPIGLMVFMIPLPVAAMSNLDLFLQHGSAYAADLMFSLAGMTFIRDNLVFRLPNIVFQVAPECSGIHSSLILFITSLMAGYLFLRSPWKRMLFAFVVIPLGLLRNGFRIFTLGELCVHSNPDWIDSWLHHKGGPVFFVLSLVPMFLLLIMLERSERNAGKTKSKPIEE